MGSFGTAIIKGVLFPTAVIGFNCGIFGGVGHETNEAFGFVIEGTPRLAAAAATEVGTVFGVAFGAGVAFPGIAFPFALGTWRLRPPTL